ncbi:MAG: LytTR family transcriptional regulator DNA-binding domain-containing protein [Bacteroidota bacterium]
MKQQQEERLKAVIVDDEDLARAIVREYLGSFHDIEIVADCANGFEAVKAITELSPDLLFLDIQMPKLNGFEVLELVQHQPAVIFVTAFDQYALKAFEVHAVDYLLKPFTRDRFDQALALARGQLRRRKSQPLAEVVAAARKKDIPLERVLVRDGSKVHVIPVEKIDYIEAQDDYIAIKAEGKTHLKQQRLAELENLLEPRRFVRIHRSFILNIERLARIELYAKDSRVAILKDGTKLQVSRAGFDKLKELL